MKTLILVPFLVACSSPSPSDLFPDTWTDAYSVCVLDPLATDDECAEHVAGDLGTDAPIVVDWVRIPRGNGAPRLPSPWFYDLLAAEGAVDPLDDWPALLDAVHDAAHALPDAREHARCRSGRYEGEDLCDRWEGGAVWAELTFLDELIDLDAYGSIDFDGGELRAEVLDRYEP